MIIFVYAFGRALPITVAACFNCSLMFTVIDLLFKIKHKEDIARGGAIIFGSSVALMSSVDLL